MSVPLLIISRTRPQPWPSSISVVLRWTPPRPPVSVIEAVNPSRDSLLRCGFSASSAGRRWRPWFPPSSVWVSLTLYFCLYLCVWLYVYVCKFVCVCLWLPVAAISDSFAWSEFSNRRFKLCSLWTWYTGDLKTDLRDDLKICTSSCSEDQMLIQTQNRVISCKCTRSPSL